MILIITPLYKEFQVIRNTLLKKGVDVNASSKGKIETLEIPSLNATLMVGGHGKVQFAVQTQYAINHTPNCQLIICTGAAGSLNEKLDMSDVIVGEATIEHDYKLKFSPKPLPIFNGDIMALEKIKTLLNNYSFSIYPDKIASGDEDIISNKRAIKIAKKTNALCVAWEGAGGAKAAKFNDIPFLEIRGITDSADKLAPADFNKNLSVAMENIAMLLIDFLKFY